MLRKIILPLVLLIFAQQNFFGMEEKEKANEDNDIKKTYDFWERMDGYMNVVDKKNKLLYLWMFLDNVPFQYGGSKIWQHGEAYYGLSNGIGLLPIISKLWMAENRDWRYSHKCNKYYHKVYENLYSNSI